VAAALADPDLPPRVVQLAVQDMPDTSRRPKLLAAAGIDARRHPRSVR
jgi:hypothetical protein